MDVKDGTSFVFNSAERVLPDLNAKHKRKRSGKVIPSARRPGAEWDDCKRPKLEAASVKEGSVAYQSLSPEAYGWPSKVSVQDACNFQKSGLPSRFMFYEQGDWKDFSKDLIGTLRDSFGAGRTSVEVSVDGKRYLINFLMMLQFNLLTGFLRSVAWIDEQGKCFFPSKLVEGNANRLLSQLQDTPDHQLRLTVTGFSSDACVRGFDSCHDGFIGICSDLAKSPETAASVEETSEITSDIRNGEAHGMSTPVSHDFALLGDKLIKLDGADQDFTAVRNRFLAGLGMLATYTTITGIYKDSHTSTSGQARLQAFIKQEEITREARGDANVRYAWHGTSKQGVSGIVLHGFGQPKVPKNGAMYGVGVYLAPEDYSHVSAVYSDVDENGEQHMVFCKTIMGSMEQVHPGSEQFHPSSEDYDTGIDDICNPKRYIIWSTHMNTHILPQYIVSFKLTPQWHGIIAALRGKQTSSKSLSPSRGPGLNHQGQFEKCTSVKVGDGASTITGSSRRPFNRAPQSPWMSFPMLFLVMKSKLPPANMVALQQHYLEFKAGRMSRDVLIKNVRTVAGDRILADSIRSMQAQEKANPSFTRKDQFPNCEISQMKESTVITMARDKNS